ncbi:MAG: transglutaminase domain-containing protein, partial [Opitutae bacterium]|nr:transglutaminase domain-containing protein [Opitutae bacterium]
MKPPPLRCLMLISLAVGLTAPAATKWPEFDRAELADTKPQIEPDADAEILLHEVVIDDSALETTHISHFYRIHIYTDRGVARFAKLELFHDRNTDIFGIEARTLLPDGTVKELGRKEAFSREVMRSGSTRLRVESFAPLALTPGVVLDYRYQELRNVKSPMNSLRFQSDLPARVVRYRFRPVDIPVIMPGFSLRCLTFNFPSFKLKATGDGYYPIEARNVQSRKVEPMQPEMIQSYVAVLLYYSIFEASTPAAYWAKKSAELHAQTERAARVTAALQTALAGIVVPGEQEADKLSKIHDFCRTRIVNRDRDSSGFTREQRRKLPANPTAADTLKHGSGTASDINILFVALARAAGLDARLALGNDRGQFLYTPDMPAPFVFTKTVAAVRRDGIWSFFDPGAGYLPPEMLDWRYCGTSALIADPKEGLIQPVAHTVAGASLAWREAKFTLDEAGTLEGDVTMTFTGYFEAAEKNILDSATTEERNKYVTDGVQKALKLAEVTAVDVGNASDPIAPIKVQYHLRVPDFAEHTGSRLFLQPAVFRKGVPPLFQTATRNFPVLFNHHYTEIDDVTIIFPDGFEVEAGSAPDDLLLGAIGNYQTSITLNKRSRQLRYQREFSLNANGVAPAHYATLKQAFDGLYARDNHLLTLK